MVQTTLTFDHDMGEVHPQKTTQKTTQKILALIRGNPEISMQGIADLIGLSEDGVKYQIRQLKNKGLIRRTGPDKGGHWQII
ncbi:MAG: winged helix-turn-helix domain-containing protein [Fibromonadaceae bacterium]|nr:winged helix-turn-helix domain-containing protein [Fibromonadaceae bacterium]